jgi:hypothetical protein
MCFVNTVAPEIDKAPSMLRAASGEGERGRLPCRAQSAPRPKFYWSRNGQSLNVNQTSKYYVEYKQIDSLTYESVLIIERVAKNDYGVYECTAKNELGITKENVRLDVSSVSYAHFLHFLPILLQLVYYHVTQIVAALPCFMIDNQRIYEGYVRTDGRTDAVIQISGSLLPFGIYCPCTLGHHKSQNIVP